jgi:hypothetical protein
MYLDLETTLTSGGDPELSESKPTWKRYLWKCALIAAPVTPITSAGNGLKLPR